MQNERVMLDAEGQTLHCLDLPKGTLSPGRKRDRSWRQEECESKKGGFRDAGRQRQPNTLAKGVSPSLLFGVVQVSTGPFYRGCFWPLSSVS